MGGSSHLGPGLFGPKTKTTCQSLQEAMSIPSYKEDPMERKERHSGDPKSSVKGKPKKDGAGGKYTMGALGSEEYGDAMDKGDPNYDSENEVEVVVKKKKSAASSFAAMGRRLLTKSVQSEVDQYVWVIQQGSDRPRIVGIYSTYEKARAKVEQITKFENETLFAEWNEEPKDSWSCECDFVKIVKYPVDPVMK